ncbi:hypothetical protein GQ457_06G013390 [Hibiscus cannabinus]
MRGSNQWVYDTTYGPVIEPKLRRPLGRSKKKRVKEVNEPSNSTGRFTKREATIYCYKCHKASHNQRTCKGEVGGNIPMNALRRTTNQRAGASISEPSESYNVGHNQSNTPTQNVQEDTNYEGVGK